MSTGGFAASVPVLTRFPYHPFRAVRISRPLGPPDRRLPAQQPPHIDVAEVDSDRAVDDAVDHRVRLHPAAEPAVPLRRGVLGAQHGRAVHIAALDELEQEADRHVVDVLGEPLVYDEQLVASVPLEHLRVRALRRGELVALHQQVRQADVAGAAPHPAGLLRDAARQVALPRARAALDDDVGGAGHELAGDRLPHEDPVDAASLVDHLPGLGVREPQPGALREALDARRALLLVGVVHHHPHPLVERHRHAGAVGLLQVERLHHLGQPHLAQLPPGLVVDHRYHPSSR